jgi:hypothetical protein
MMSSAYKATFSVRDIYCPGSTLEQGFALCSSQLWRERGENLETVRVRNATNPDPAQNCDCSPGPSRNESDINQPIFKSK